MPNENKEEKRVFISHGHDENTLLKIEKFLKDSLQVKPVILKEQHLPGLTIIEKLENASKKCQFALVLITGDDETKQGKKVARQNVVHEIGFLQGVLGRKRVLLCKETGIDTFSNISGLVYIDFPKGQIELIYETIRQSIDNLNAEPYAESIPVEKADGDNIAGKIVDFISTENDTTKKRIKNKFEELFKNLEHLDDPEKIDRIEFRLASLVKECDDFDKKHETELIFAVEKEPPKNPIGAALGNALVASVNASIKKEHKVIREAYEDIKLLKKKGKDFNEIETHLRKLFQSE